MLGVVLKALSLTASYYVFSAAVVLLRPAVQQIVEPLEDKLLATVQKRVADMGGSGATKNKPVKLADALPKGGARAHQQREFTWGSAHSKRAQLWMGSAGALCDVQ